MKSGDLVKMKYVSFWLKKLPSCGTPYTETPLLVLEASYNAIKVIMPDGQVKIDLAEHYEVVETA